jgi:imidazolonepropionase
MIPTVDLIIDNIGQLATCAAEAPKRGEALKDVGLLENVAIAVRDGRIIAIEPHEKIHEKYVCERIVDAAGKAVVPGFVDAHTHVVYAGDRIGEFELRIKGADYLEILAAGGGIISTMQTTRNADVSQLVAESMPRLQEMMLLGTTTAEVKTGYGLSTESELKMLEAIEELAKTQPMTLVPTFLGAHAIPPEFSGRSDDYTYLVAEEMLPRVQHWYRHSIFPQSKIPLFVDVFCEKNAFSLEQSRQVLQAGIALGFPVKIHTDEFTALGATLLAVELKAVSADHLDVTPLDEREKLAKSQTIAVFIPAVSMNFGSATFADARGFADAGAAIALATDINPGSAPCPSMPLVMALACRYEKLLPAEALNASTINAAFAIGMGEQVGSIQPGKKADLLILKYNDYRHVAYQIGGNPIKTVFKNGVEFSCE